MDEDKKNIAYDDYRSITTINDDQIIQENFDCDSDNKLILRGTIKRKVEEINHVDCTGSFNQILWQSNFSYTHSQKLFLHT